MCRRCKPVKLAARPLRHIGNPLPQRHTQQDLIGEMRCLLHHAPRVERGAHPGSLAREREQEVVPAPRPRKAMCKDFALQVVPVLRTTWQAACRASSPDRRSPRQCPPNGTVHGDTDRPEMTDLGTFPTKAIIENVVSPSPLDPKRPVAAMLCPRLRRTCGTGRSTVTASLPCVGSQEKKQSDRAM